jgi:hypothetical protein
MKKSFATLLILFFVYILKAQIEIPLQIDEGGYISLKVRFNDKEEARFLLDTGGGVNVVSQSLFNKLGSLSEEGLYTGTRHNGEQITGMLYLLPSLSIGSFTKKNVIIGQYADLRNYDGILSMSYFEDVPFSIDFVNKKLQVETKHSIEEISSHAQAIPIEVKKTGKYEVDLFVKICINDSVQARAEFDTGAGFNMLMLHPSYLKKLNITVPDKTTDYGYYIYSTTLPKLSFCNSNDLYETHHFVGFKEGLIYEGLIGSGIFRNKVIAINIPGHELLVWNK